MHQKSKIGLIFSAGITNAFIVVTAYSLFKIVQLIFDRNKMGKEGFQRINNLKKVGINNLNLAIKDSFESKRKKDLQRQIMASTSFSIYNLSCRKIALFFEPLLSPFSEFTFSRAALNFKLLPGYLFLRFKKIRILSIGCRDRIEIVAIQNRFPNSEVVGVDLFAAPNSGIVPGDMHELPFDDNSFDILISAHSLEHADDYLKAGKEFVRVAKNKGFIIIEVPCANPIGDEPTDWHTYKGVRSNSPDNWDYHNPECLNKIFGGKTNIVISDLDDPDQIKTCFQVSKD